jgi:hypothetical protein
MNKPAAVTQPVLIVLWILYLTGTILPMAMMLRLTLRSKRNSINE